MKRTPRKNFVLTIENKSNALEIFEEKIWVIVIKDITNIENTSIEKIPRPNVMIKNQKDNPAVTVRDFILGEVSFI